MHQPVHFPAPQSTTVIDPDHARIRRTEVFKLVMKASSYSYLFWTLAGAVLFVLLAFVVLTLIANPGARLPPAVHLTVTAR